MNARAAFISWLRDRRERLVSATGNTAALDALGLTDHHLARWESTERHLTTLPHASPNVFFPRVGVAWFARHLQRRDPALVHVRIVLTHTNFSDLGWRPYAWWYLDRESTLRRSTLFTRNKKAKHVIVASQPPLPGVPVGAQGVDEEAARLARHGADRAISYMIIMAMTEHAAGLAISDRTIYLPLPLVVEFARHQAHTGGGPLHRWLAGLLVKAQGRQIDADGKLADVADSRHAYVFDNATNIAMLAALGPQQIIGGAKMAAYWPEVQARAHEAWADSGMEMAEPGRILLPSIDYTRFVGPSPALHDSLTAAGIAYSQGLAVAEHGRFADSLDPFA